jgi:hypothetical protein
MRPEMVEQVADLYKNDKFMVKGNRVYSKETMWSISQIELTKIAEETGKSFLEVLKMCGVDHAPVHDSHTVFKQTDLGGR